MSEQLLSYALTTVQRVKDRLAITGANFDTLIQRLINSATYFIESETNRHFAETTYTDEVYSIYGAKQDMVFLKNAPVSAITSAQYRAGTPSNPAWTNFTADEYELVEDGKSGIVKLYGLAGRGINALRFTYTAGYKINFTNAGDMVTHTLPADITDLCERLVIRWFKRRESEGKTSEAFDGGQINWQSELTNEDKETIARYRRLPAFL
ncbi:MAG: hypothetical protein KatS3mg101_1072 [Patescibacteria group bacterium]|nr:MAG: hypothetical protein KatS3mg101_1072 [Patescibacteria group bacterium]